MQGQITINDIVIVVPSIIGFAFIMLGIIVAGIGIANYDKKIKRLGAIFFAVGVGTIILVLLKILASL